MNLCLYLYPSLLQCFYRYNTIVMTLHICLYVNQSRQPLTTQLFVYKIKLSVFDNATIYNYVTRTKFPMNKVFVI